MNRNDVHKGYISKMSLHDRELLGAIVGLAKTCGNNPYTDDTIKLICDALLAFNEGCDKAQAEEWLAVRCVRHGAAIRMIMTSALFLEKSRISLI